MSKISNTLIENAEILDIAMHMCNPLVYSDNYSMTSGSLSSYYRHEINDGVNENKNASKRIKKEKTITNKFFEY